MSSLLLFWGYLRIELTQLARSFSGDYLQPRAVILCIRTTRSTNNGFQLCLISLWQNQTSITVPGHEIHEREQEEEIQTNTGFKARSLSGYFERSVDAIKPFKYTKCSLPSSWLFSMTLYF